MRIEITHRVKFYGAIGHDHQFAEPICCAWPKVTLLPKRRVREELTEDARARAGEVGR